MRVRLFCKNFVAALLLGMGLASCENTGPATYSLTPPATSGGRVCVNNCLEAETACVDGCNLNDKRCFNGVQTQAMQDYDRYVREQVHAHLPTELHMSDFESDRPCDQPQKICLDGCEKNYRSCYQSCGGTVNLPLSCLLMCF